MMTERSVNKKLPRIVYAGDRDISVQVLQFIIRQGVKPVALMIPNKNRATHAGELLTLCNYLDKSRILEGDEFKKEHGINLLNDLKPDYIICVHFAYVIPRQVLGVPNQGVLNLHPAYLPYNRGWNTPTWAIWEGTPYGATLHFMDEGIDTGDIVHQKPLEILPNDTAHTLYKRVKELEFEVFRDAWPSIVSGKYSRKQQSSREGTTHRKTDIESIQFVDLNKGMRAGYLLRLIRALTTSNVKESAYFKVNQKLYRMQLYIVEDVEQKD